MRWFLYKLSFPDSTPWALVSSKLIIFLISSITWEQWNLTVKLELPRNRDLYLFKIVLIFINLLLWSGYTELRTDAFSVRSFAPNSVNSEQCKQAKSCYERIVQTVQTEWTVRTANRANNHTNSSYCWNIANSTNSSFLRNRRTGRTGAKFDCEHCSVEPAYDEKISKRHLFLKS